MRVGRRPLDGGRESSSELSISCLDALSFELRQEPGGCVRRLISRHVDRYQVSRPPAKPVTIASTLHSNCLRSSHLSWLMMLDDPCCALPCVRRCVCCALLCQVGFKRVHSLFIPLVLYPAKGPRHGSVHGPLTTKIPEPDDPTINVTTARSASSTLHITCLRPVEVAGVAVSRIHMHGLPQRVDLIYRIPSVISSYREPRSPSRSTTRGYDG